MNDEREIHQAKNGLPAWRAQLVALWDERRHIILVLVLLLFLEVLVISLPEGLLASLGARLIARGGLIALLALFGLLALSLLWSAGQRLDAWLFLSFNARGRRGRGLDGFMWGVTQIGNGLLALGLAGMLYWTGYRRQATVLALGTLTLWLVVETFKAITGRGRPATLLTETRIVGGGARGKSFPSGHTTQTFFLTALIVHIFQLPPWAGLLLYGVAGLVGFTRVYVGAHYPRDVLAGALLGQVWGILSVLVLE
jgi:membrane-associated phospholipid phosphatase